MSNEIRRLKSTGHWVGGQWVDSAHGQPLESICPVDGSVVYSGSQADNSIVDQAVTQARSALEKWTATTLEQRSAYVLRYAELIEANGDELAELISAETGKPIWESKTEVAAVVGKSALSVDAIKSRRSTTAFELGAMSAVTRFKPYGVLGVLGPFNFPAHLPNGHIMPALLAGNTIVFKASEQTPAVGQWMVQKWQEAELPDAVVNLVQGGREVGMALASHRQLDGLLFTGSSRAGTALHKAYGNHPEKILALEMGGNNPLIVDEVADIKAAAYTTVNSAFITAGQRCTCARRLIVIDNHRAQPFIDELVRMMGQTRIGAFYQKPEPFAGTVISADQGATLLKAQDQLIRDGGEAIVKMSALNDNPAMLSPGLVDVTSVEERGDEEMFGPILSMIRVDSFEEAIAEANDTAYGLSAGLLSDSRDRFELFISKIRAGIANWNRQTTGATGKLPFGGCGLSGNHHPGGYFAADYCSFPVASLESNTLEMPEKLVPGIKV